MMLLKIILYLIPVLSSVALFIYTWKHNVESNSKKNKIKPIIVFYDNDKPVKSKPQYASDFKNLDSHVSGTVRYNQSMYYSKDDIDNIRSEILNYKFPI